MIRSLAGIGAAALLCGCATVASPAAPGESLAMELNSWGKPIHAWTLSQAGEGRYSTARDAPSGIFQEYDLVTSSFRASAAEVARIQALLRPGRPFAGRELPCRLKITDGMYGKVRWGDGPPVSFNFGCLSATVTPIYRGIIDAEELVERLAAAGTVVEVKGFRQPAQ